MQIASNYIDVTKALQNKIDIKAKNLEKLKDSCDNFESEILNFYMKSALKQENTLFPKSPGEKIYEAMRQEQISQQVSGNFGYSELLFNYLKDKNNL